jgi:hypothetical protein
MAYDRPSWRDIDKMRDGGARKKPRERKDQNLKDHSSRYDKYKEDLNRLFDQGMAGELLKKLGKDAPGSKGQAEKEKKGRIRNNGNGRAPINRAASVERLSMIRAIAEAEDLSSLTLAIDNLEQRFGLLDDWEILVRVLEHPNEELVLKAVIRMKNLLPVTNRIPRRATLKERLRSISQTASSQELRAQAAEMEAGL